MEYKIFLLRSGYVQAPRDSFQMFCAHYLSTWSNWLGVEYRRRNISAEYRYEKFKANARVWYEEQDTIWENKDNLQVVGHTWGAMFAKLMSQWRIMLYHPRYCKYFTNDAMMYNLVAQLILDYDMEQAEYFNKQLEGHDCE